MHRDLCDLGSQILIRILPKERTLRRALGEFQKVRYFKTCACTWVIELFPEWLV